MSVEPASTGRKVTDPMVRPSRSRFSLPVSNSRPCTSGICSVGRPVEMTTVTTLLGARGVPATGSVSMTKPSATVSCASRFSPTRNPASVNWLNAVNWVTLRTSGTKIWPGPVDTVMVTASPALNSVPASGFWRMTVPASA